MLIPPPSATFKVVSSSDEYQESILVRCSPVGFLDDAVSMEVLSDRAYPKASPSVKFDHLPHRDPSVADIPAAASFVEAYAYLVDLAQWIVDTRAMGVGVQQIEKQIEASMRRYREAA
ncbi:hypothetical protein V0M98_32320 (plasmid) [Pseudomonas silesiensis]|uniref:hypothetical protein n=1 Tax=Pseudomonas silesiensis TaxID=1853130 RepID=UPI0030CB530E